MSTAPMEEKGLVASLFDFEFKTFVTMRFLRIIYAVLLVAIVLFGLGFLAAALDSGSVVGLIIAPLMTFIQIVLLRVSVEMVVLFFRIAENTSIMAGRGGLGGFGYGGPAGYPPTGPAGYPPAAPAGGDEPVPRGEPGPSTSR